MKKFSTPTQKNSALIVICLTLVLILLAGGMRALFTQDTDADTADQSTEQDDASEPDASLDADPEPDPEPEPEAEPEENFDEDAQNAAELTALLEEIDYMKVFYASGGGFQFDETLWATVTDEEDIASMLTFFKSGTVMPDVELEDAPSNPYYYEFYADDEMVAQYIFRDNDFGALLVKGEFQTVTYPEAVPELQLEFETMPE